MTCTGRITAAAFIVRKPLACRDGVLSLNQKCAVSDVQLTFMVNVSELASDNVDRGRRHCAVGTTSGRP